MSTELRRLYEMCGGLEKDRFAEEEGARMIEALAGSGGPFLNMWIDVGTHTVGVSFPDRTSTALPIRALGESDRCRISNDREVETFAAYWIRFYSERAAAKEGK